MEEHNELLRACFQLLRKQEHSCYVINMHEQIVNLDSEVECDGAGLQDMIKDYLESNDIDIDELDNGEVNV